jgi:hypothetical protein
MPKLSIVAHSCHKRIAIGFVSDGILVAIAIIIINEACHTNKEVVAGDRVVFSTVGEFIEGVKIYAAVEIPDWWGRATALACAKNWAVVAVLVEAVGDSHFRFDPINSVLEHITVDCCNVLVKAKGSADNAG